MKSSWNPSWNHHEIIMKSIIFVGENTWTSHFLSPFLWLNCHPKSSMKLAAKQWPRLPLEPRWLQSFTFCSKEVGGTQECSSDSVWAFHLLAHGKKSLENEIFYPAKMILQLFFWSLVSKIWHVMGSGGFFPWLQRSSYQRGQQTGRWISCCAGPWTPFEDVGNDSNLWWLSAFVKVLDISQCLGTQLLANDSRDDVSSFILTRGTCEWMMFLCGKLWKNILRDRLFQWVHWACRT